MARPLTVETLLGTDARWFATADQEAERLIDLHEWYGDDACFKALERLRYEFAPEATAAEDLLTHINEIVGEILPDLAGVEERTIEDIARKAFDARQTAGIVLGLALGVAFGRRAA